MPRVNLSQAEKDLIERWKIAARYQTPRLSGLTIEGNDGIRGITNLAVNFDRPITVICGKNGCGKSTVISLSRLGFQQDRQFDDLFIEINNPHPFNDFVVHWSYLRHDPPQISLDVFDLINALLKPKGLQLKHMWREAEPRLASIETERMDRYVLQTMSLLCQNYCSPKYLYFLLPEQEKNVREPDGKRRKEILIRDTHEFETLWKQAVKALESSIRLLRDPREYGAIVSKYMPYVSILPVFASIQAHIESLPAEKKLDAQRKVRAWYWASVFTNRYSGAVESTSARDFLDFKAWLADDAARPALLAEFESRFQGLDLRRETKRGSSIYNGVFNLLILQGARDWTTGLAPQYDDLDDHHIIPISWSGAEDLEEVSVDTILNRTPLTAETNRQVIHNRLPNEYLPEMMARNGEALVRDIFTSHLISPKAFEILLRVPFTPIDFMEFIAERERTIKQAIESLLIRGRLDLQPLLRDLDERIEKVELALRTVIADALRNNPTCLPGHIRPKIEERLQTALRRNPALSGNGYETLIGKLEFADLRELEDIIVAKDNWPHFEARFYNKPLLSNRFGQLAELRNSIRHSRTVTELVKKDGEAALLWFEEVLKP